MSHTIPPYGPIAKQEPAKAKINENLTPEQSQLIQKLNSGKIDDETVNAFMEITNKIEHSSLYLAEGKTDETGYVLFVDNFLNKVDIKALKTLSDNIKKRLEKFEGIMDFTGDPEKMKLEHALMILNSYFSFKSIPAGIQKYDTNRDGMIDETEVKNINEFIKSLKSLTGKEFETALGKVDVSLKDKILKGYMKSK